MIIRRFCPHTLLGYSLLIAALLLVPAIAMAARVSAIDYTIAASSVHETPAGFSKEDRTVLTKHLKATKWRKAEELQYSLGGYLPDPVGYKHLPDKVAKKLSHLPEGYSAVRVGNDIVLISELSRQIIDVVTL